MLGEAGGWGIFAERVGNYYTQNLMAKLRFRHGGSAAAPLRDPADLKYTPGQRADFAFRDGHVESLTWQKATRAIDAQSNAVTYTSADKQVPGFYTSLWLGSPCPRPASWIPDF